MKAIKSNMKDQISTNDDHILHCLQCNGEWSGNAGDYWFVSDNHVFTCENCGVELELVRKVITIDYID